MPKKSQAVMTAKNKSVPLFDGFVKFIVGLIVLIYLFGYLWYPSLTPNAIINFICFFGLCFRFSFILNDKSQKLKISITFFFYLISFFDHMFDVFVNIEKGLSFSVVIVLALISIFILDLFQFKRISTSQ